MAIDPFGKIEDDANTTVQSGVSLLKTAIGISPVAAGIWYGQRSLKANEAVNTPIRRATPSQALGKAQGAKARASIKARNAQAVKLAEKLKQGLTQSDVVKGVLQNVQEHNALLHSLSVTLENPASGLDTSAVQTLKGQIQKLLSNSTPESVEEFANKVTSAILDTGNSETLLQWEDTLDQYRKLGAQLQAPDYTIPTSGNPVNRIDAGTIRSRGANSMVERRLLQVEAAVNAGGDKGNRVVMNSFTEGGLQFHQAQVFNSKGNWVHSMALHSDHNFFRSGGDLNTLYTQPKYAMNAQAADSFIRSGGLKARDVGLEGLKRAGAIGSFFDYQVSELSSRASRGSLNFRDFRSDMGLATQHVTRSAIGTDPFNENIRVAATMDSNVVFGYNIKALGKRANTVLANIAAGEGFDPGAAAKRLVTGFGAEQRSVIGLMEGSGFEAMRQTYGGFAVDRNQLPITYREAQLMGRTSFGADDFQQVGAHFIGPVGTRHKTFNNEPITQGLRGKAPGSINQLMVVDFKAKGIVSRAYGDKGLAITGRSHRVSSPVEFSVLDPKMHGHAASDTFKRIVASGDYGTVFSAEEVSKNLFVGETGSGTKTLGRDPRLEELHLQLDRKGISYDKHMVYFKGQKVRKMDFLKLFSMSFKGNLSNVGEAAIDRLHKQDTDLSDLFKSLSAADGLNMNDPALKYKAAYASSDMFGKGSFSFVNQISSSARMLGLHQVDITDRATSIHEQGRSIFGKSASGHQIYAQAATELLGERGVRGSQIGMVLAGVYHGAGGSSMEGGVLKQGKHGLDRGKLLQLVESAVGGNMQERGDALAAMERGKVAMVDTATVGPSAGDWKAARVGAERRFAQTAYERFTQLGMGGSDAAAAVAEVYSKKIGFAQSYQFANEMTSLGRSVSGMRNIFDAATEKGATRLTYGEMQEQLITGTKNADVNEFLSKQAKGTVLDFSDAPAAVRNAVQDTFGMSSMYLPGTAAYQAASGTELRVAGGQSKQVASEYGQLIKGLFGRIASHQTTGGDPLRASLGEFKEKALGLMSSSIANLSRGKIKGTSSPRADSIDLTTGAALTSDQTKVGRQLFKGTAGTSVFADATYLLSELHAQKGAGLRTGDLAEQARMFFTGLEHKEVSKRAGSGLIRLLGRDPLISAGNVFVSQVFRDVREVQTLGGTDSFFGKVQASSMTILDGVNEKTMSGKELMREIFKKDINSFADIAESDMGDQKRFFNALVNNIDQFSGGQGGGRMIVPSLMAKGADGTMRDIGLAPQAFMDMDGDTVKSMFLTTKRGKQVRALIQQQKLDPAALANELQMRTIKGQMGEAIKAGMVKHGSNIMGPGGVPLGDVVIHDMMKEVGISQSTGGLDVSLRPAHEAIGNYVEDGRKARGFRDLLGALEENVLLKAKKVPVFVPLAEELGRGVTGLMQDPTEANREILRSILKDKVFAGQSTTFEVGRMESSVMGDFVSEATRGYTTRVDIDDFVDQTYMAAKAAQSNNTVVPGTAKGLARGFLETPEKAFLQLLVGQNMEAAAMGVAFDNPQAKLGVANEAMQKMGNLFGQVDRRMMGPIALGVGASLMAMSAIGNPGYAPEPLTAPGEIVPGEVSDAIAQGSLFQAPDPSVSPSSLLSRPASDYGMLDRPINSGAAYMERPSSYQIRGQLPNGAGLSNTMSYLNSLGSGPMSGSIRLNDTRRPITRSYVDRMLGEY